MSKVIGEAASSVHFIRKITAVRLAPETVRESEMKAPPTGQENRRVVFMSTISVKLRQISLMYHSMTSRGRTAATAPTVFLVLVMPKECVCVCVSLLY